MLKALVAVKRVRDPDNANKIQLRPSGDGLDASALEWKTNPFDEYAVETALRMTEDGRATKVRRGEVVVVTFGPAESASTLRAALAMGADRAIRIEAEDESLDGRLVAAGLASLAAEESPDLIILGKQAVDSDGNQVGQMLAELLDWPMATCSVALREEGDALRIEREVDGGTIALKVRLPAVVTVDLRVVAPASVYSMHTPVEHRYPEGVRFVPLPAVIAARRKPFAVRMLSDVLPSADQTSHYFGFRLPPARAPGRIVASVSELVDLLGLEAKVI